MELYSHETHSKKKSKKAAEQLDGAADHEEFRFGKLEKHF